MKTVLTICGFAGILSGILYWAGILEPNEVLTGSYALGWGLMCAGAAMNSK